MDFPEDIGEQVKELHNNLTELMINCDKLLKNYENLKFKSQDNPLKLASLDLTISFAINSLFWLYMFCNGQDLKDHNIKNELNRIKSSLIRLNAIKDKDKAPKVNSEAAQRVVRNALFDPKNDWKKENEDDEPRPNKKRKFF